MKKMTALTIAALLVMGLAWYNFALAADETNTLVGNAAGFVGASTVAGTLSYTEFYKELQKLQTSYTELVKGVKDEFTAQAKEIKDGLTAAKTELKEATDAVKEAFKEEKKDLEADQTKVKKEQTDKLTAARKDFITELKAIIKEGDWKKVVGSVKKYIAKKETIGAEYKPKLDDLAKKIAGLGDKEKKAIADLTAEFQKEIKALTDSLAGLDKEKKEALDTLKIAAEEEVKALCEEHGIPYSPYYVPNIFTDTASFATEGAAIIGNQITALNTDAIAGLSTATPANTAQAATVAQPVTAASPSLVGGTSFVVMPGGTPVPVNSVVSDITTTPEVRKSTGTSAVQK